MAEIAFEDSSEPPEAVGFSCILAALRSKHRPRRAHKCAQIPESFAAELPRISTRQEQPNNLRASWRESPGRLNYAQEHAHPYRRIRSHPNAVCFDTRAVTSLLHPENLRTSRVGITRHSAESQPSAIRARNPRITRMSLGSRQCPLRRFRGYTADRQGQRSCPDISLLFDRVNDLDAAEILAKHLGNNNRAVGELILLDHCREDTRGSES